MGRGIVISSSRGNFLVKSELDGYQIICKLKGTLKKENMTAVPGDFVNFQKFENTYIVDEIFERKNLLIRPKIANVKRVIIVQSIIEPSIKVEELYRFIAYFNFVGIDNIILALTKTDLLKDKLSYSIIECFKLDGIEVINSNEVKDFEKLVQFLNDGLTLFMGQSGVGKSTLINKIDSKLKIKTSEVSKNLKRGRHTTTITTLHSHKDGFIVDTPGFSAFKIDYDKEDFRKSFTIFYKNYNNCKFRNCYHLNEKDCEIKKLVQAKKISTELYNFYQKEILKYLKNKMD